MGAFDLSFDGWVGVSQERKWGECSRQREEGSKAPRHDPAGGVRGFIRLPLEGQEEDKTRSRVF